MSKIVIGLVGPIAAGKSTTVGILKSKGFMSYSLSDRIREEIQNRNLEITRETLNQVSNDLRETVGADVLAQKTSTLIEKENSEKIVIDSIRNPLEIAYLKKHFGMYIIGLVAPQEIRFDFFAHRGTNVAGITTWEEFKALDDMELAQSGEYKQQVQACLDLADIIIENTGSIEELEKKLEEILKNLKINL
jgi:dephospho-CoA kinase